MMITYKQLDEMEAVFEGTSDWTCPQCYRPHSSEDYHCMCGIKKPTGRAYVPDLIKEVRKLKKKLNKARQNG